MALQLLFLLLRCPQHHLLSFLFPLHSCSSSVPPDPERPRSPPHLPTSPPGSLPTKGPSHQETLRNCEVSRTGTLKGRKDLGEAFPSCPASASMAPWLFRSLAMKAPSSPYSTPVVSLQSTERSDLYRDGPPRTATHQLAWIHIHVPFPWQLRVFYIQYLGL